jgi:hypothetical protein
MYSCVLDPNFTLWNVYLPRAGASRPNSFLFASSLPTNWGIDAKLVLTFDAFALSRSLGRELGDDHATSKVKTSALNSELLGQDYKNYILFYKRLCDQWECEADESVPPGATAGRIHRIGQDRTCMLLISSLPTPKAVSRLSKAHFASPLQKRLQPAMRFTRE